jgi:hypothetical protein
MTGPDRYDMLFAAEMSQRYHRRRAAFLERVSMLMTLTSLVGGAGAFLSLIGEPNTEVAQFATFIVAIVGIFQAVFRVDNSASENKRWLSEWLSLLTDIYVNPEPSESKINEWIEKRHLIESQCVFELRALQTDCYNKTLKSLDWEGIPVRLRFWHKLFIQVWSFEGSFEKSAS